MAEVLTGTTHWIHKINNAQTEHERRLEKIKKEILLDESLPDLERAILGLSGSPETLNRYQELAKRIGALSGKPIVVAERPGSRGEKSKHISHAQGGLLTGVMSVNFEYPLSAERVPENINGAQILAQVDPLLSYTYSEGNRYPSPPVSENITVNAPGSGYKIAEGLGYIPLSSFGPDYRSSQRTVTGEYLTSEYSRGIILMGRPEIYESKLFHEGVSTLLNHLEDQ